MAVATTAREIRVLAPTGALGSGFLESSLAAAIDLCPHVIGCDAGTTDGGPYYLGSGETAFRSEEHTSELQSLMRISYAVFCLKKKNNTIHNETYEHQVAM